MASRMLAAIVVLTLPASFLAGVASADSHNDVAALSVRLIGVTKEKSSFSATQKRSDELDLTLGDGTFSAPSLSGTYQQKRRKVRFRVDSSWLESYEQDWASRFGDYLKEEGLVADSLSCVTRKAKVKGRSKHGSFHFRSKYEFRCVATGDFGEIAAKARVKFLGRGELVGELPTKPQPPLYSVRGGRSSRLLGFMRGAGSLTTRIARRIPAYGEATFLRWPSLVRGDDAVVDP